MRAVFEKIESDAGESFVIREIDQPYFDAPWFISPDFLFKLENAKENLRYIRLTVVSQRAASGPGSGIHSKGNKESSATPSGWPELL